MQGLPLEHAHGIIWLSAMSRCHDTCVCCQVQQELAGQVSACVLLYTVVYLLYYYVLLYY